MYKQFFSKKLIWKCFSSLVQGMNKMFSKSNIIQTLELTLDYIVLNYCLRESACFANTDDNFIKVTSLHDRRLTTPNITAQLNQCCEKNVSTFTVRRRLCEAGLYGRIVVKKPVLRKQNYVKRFQWAKLHKNWTIEHWNKVV